MTFEKCFKTSYFSNDNDNGSTTNNYHLPEQRTDFYGHLVGATDNCHYFPTIIVSANWHAAASKTINGTESEFAEIAK